MHGQWNRLNTPLHMATYAINLKWYDPITRTPPSQDREVMEGFMNVFRKIYGSTKEAPYIRFQFDKFSRGQGVFASPTFVSD